MIRTKIFGIVLAFLMLLGSVITGYGIKGEEVYLENEEEITVSQGSSEAVTLPSFDLTETPLATPEITGGIIAANQRLISVEGYYWIDRDIPANGLRDVGIDDLGAMVGRTVRVLNLNTGYYEQNTGVIDENGHYRIDDLPAGYRCCIEFSFIPDSEIISPMVEGGSWIFGDSDGIGHGRIDTTNFEDGQVGTVNAAVFNYGYVNVRFTTDGTDAIGEAERVKIQVPSTYTATIGSVTDINAGTFKVPQGYRLVAGEATTKNISLDPDNREGNIIFWVERIIPGLNSVKTSSRAGETLEVGDRIVYTIQMTNDTEGILNQVKVEDVVPANTKFINASGNVRPDENGHLVWNVDEIGVGETKQVSYVVEIEKNKDKVSRWEVISDRGTVNDKALNSTRDTVVQAVLSSSQKSNIPRDTEVKRGQIVTYSIEVENKGEGTGRDIDVIDELPLYTQYIEGSIKGGEGTYKNGKITFNLSELAPGEKAVLEFQVRVN